MSRGRWALITGASAGIGAAFARRAAQDGYNLVLVARRQERLQQIAEQLRARHDVEAACLSYDLCDPAAPEEIFDQLTEEGKEIHALVNNAGYSIRHAFNRTALEQQRRFVELTVMAPIALTHLALRGMLARGEGRIINIASIAAFSTGGKGHTLYPAGKSFLIKFSQSLSAEVRERGIGVTAVAPAFVATEFQQANEIEDSMRGTPDFLIQQPEEIAAEAWRRNARGTEVVVPGALPKFGAAFLRYIPEQLISPITRKAAADRYTDD